uniref:Uncharacterized protein n=1 Tax=Arion vulgaris TaxID=1028688 RepID=A0A0B6Y9X7_9EUPU
MAFTNDMLHKDQFKIVRRDLQQFLYTSFLEVMVLLKLRDSARLISMIEYKQLML